MEKRQINANCGVKSIEINNKNYKKLKNKKLK